MKYLKKYNLHEPNDKYMLGYRSQGLKRLHYTSLEKSSEGVGIYIAKSKSFNDPINDFSIEGDYLFEIKFKIPKKFLKSPNELTINNSLIYYNNGSGLERAGIYGEIWDKPIKATDSDWIRFHKLAIINSKNKKGEINIKKAYQYLSLIAKENGYEAFDILPNDKKHGWWVLLYDSLIIDYKRTVI